MEPEEDTYESFGGEPWPWHEGDDEPLADPNPSNGYSEVDEYPCGWWKEPADPNTDPEWGGDHEQWDPEWPYGEWGPDQNHTWDSEMWEEYDSEWPSAEWGESSETQLLHSEGCDPNAEGTSVDKSGNKQPQYYGKDGALLPLTLDDLVLFLGEKGCTDRDGVSSFLWDVPHEDYFRLLVEDARQHPAVEQFEAYTTPFTVESWKFLGDDTDEIEDLTELILYLGSPDPALFQDDTDHSTAKAWIASNIDESMNGSDESWATGDVHGDIPDSTNHWDLAYEGNDPWWGGAGSCLEDSVNEKPMDDGSEDINQSWGDDVVPYDQFWKGWDWGSEWDEPQIADPIMNEFLGELENELDKIFEPSGGSTPAALEDPRHK